MMITIQAGKRALGVCLLLLLVASCSREQQDWRSAESADTIESYGQFIQRHPESELTTQARTRVAQLGEDRDWQRAGSADTADAYRQFIAQHPSGRWTQEARIRLDNFSLGAQSGEKGARGSGDATVRADRTAQSPSQVGSTTGGARAFPGESASAAAGPARSEGVSSPRGTTRGAAGLAVPGESASPAEWPAGGAAAAAGGVRPAAEPGALASAVTRTSPGSGGGSGAGAFGVQLGAFSSEANAANQWRVLSGQFGSELQGLSERVVAADTASGRIYRLQAMGGDELRARAVCEALRKRSQGCVPVLPR